jgi:hypothetical protein
MKTDLQRLNEEAMTSFEKARQKVLGNVKIAEQASNSIANVVEYTNAISIEPPDNPTYNKCMNVLELLDTLDISNDLKLSISHIIASSDKDKVKNLQKAISYINKELE